MTSEEEARKLKVLKDAGYTIELLNPVSKNLKEKYSVYRDMPPLGKRYVITDENLNIIGSQG